jgi:hypothetical protein
MNTKKIVSALVCGTVLLGSSAYALEVDRKVLPRITLGGRLITTLDSDESINIDDSSFAARFDKRMYENGVAGGVLGIRQDEGTVKFNQMHVFFWNRDIETKAGRTRLPNTLIEFPLLRDEDLLSMTHVGNASSNNEFDQLFGKTASFDWVLDQKVQKLGAWFGTRRNDPAISTVDGFDSYGASYRYELPETLRYLKRIRHAGIMLDAQKDSAGSNEFFQSLIAGAEFNLNINPKSNWSMGAQAIFNSGVPGVTQGQLNNANAVSNRARAKSTAFVTSLRYTKRPHLLTRMQGYKSYDVGGSEVSIVPNLAYRIGEGVDLLFQYRNTQYRDGLAEIGPTNLFQIGMVFNLDATYNDTIGERDSILNLEHGYIQ